MDARDPFTGEQGSDESRRDDVKFLDFMRAQSGGNSIIQVTQTPIGCSPFSVLLLSNADP